MIQPRSVALAVDEFLAVIAAEGASVSTQRAYRNALSSIADVLTDEGIDLSTVAADNFAAALSTVQDRRELRDSSMQVYWGATRAFLRWAYGASRIQVPLADQVHPPPTGSSRVTAWAPDEATLGDVERATYAWSRSELRDRALALLFLHAGLEVAEAAALDGKDIDFDRRILAVGGAQPSGREVPLTARLAGALRALAAEEAAVGPAIRNAQDERLTVRGIRDVIARLGEHVGAPQLTARSLRTAYLRRETARGVPLDVLARRAGFSSVTALRQRLGVLAVETEACTSCGGQPNLGPVERRCEMCFGTGALLQPPVGYVRELTRVRACQRMKADSTELRRLAFALEEVAIGPATAERMTEVGVALWEAACSLQSEHGELPTQVRAAALPALEEVVWRLRAIGTEMRKLGLALNAVGWARPGLSVWLQREGAGITLLAIALEDGERGVSV